VRAIVTGAAGQDGTLLRKLLADRGVDVLGIVRPAHDTREEKGTRLSDASAVRKLIDDVEPDFLFHLAAAHHSSERETDDALRAEMEDTNVRAAELFASIITERRPTCRLLLAGSSQMYRAPTSAERVVNEATPMDPATFYGETKARSREMLGRFRERGLFGVMTILFNHESELRPPQFVTRKITMAAARAKRGQRAGLHLRDITSRTDWSSAHDMVEGMWLALNASEPRDYVLASGVAHTIQDVLEVAFGSVDLDWRKFTTYDRPPTIARGTLIGDVTRARTTLGWRPKVSIEQMIRDMVRADLDALSS
jgi:GDPmannose 4,6-dehydratase